MLFESEVITNKSKEKLFNEIVDDHKLMVVNTCYGFVHNYDDADDIAQDVFIDIWTKLDSFREESKISTWIYRIAVNKSLNFLRGNKSNPIIGAIESFKECLFNPITQEPEIESDVKESKIKSIHKAINKLPEKQKTAFVLFYYEGLVYKEIAEITDSTIPAIESILFRARNNVKKYLKDINVTYE